MCGIAGIFNMKGNPIADSTIATRMASALVHRGPDEEGYLVDGPVAFGFRRLSIIDLNTGHQPVSNDQRTVWTMFNGEIYNFVELRHELETRGCRFRTQSDSEVIVYAYKVYGLDFVQHLRGMFAIALWDAQQQRLVLARDRVGKKPLFYSLSDYQLAFASELKALRAWPRLERSLNAAALDDYLTSLYVPAPNSIFSRVHKLPPAHMLVADCAHGSYSVQRYWRVSPESDDTKPLAFYVDGLREVLTEAVRLRLRSDVPLGAFLSGGVDSTISVGLMAREVSPVRTFSIRFPDKRFDESRYARLASTSFRTLHTEETVDSASFTPDELGKLVWYMDEPFGDSSFIPTYWVSKIARRHVTVALSGDGGDELFAGYARYRNFQMLARIGLLPAPVRRLGGNLADLLRRLMQRLSPALAERLRQAHKALQLSGLPVDERMLALLTFFDDASKTQLYRDDWRSQINGYKSWARLSEQIRTAGSTDEALAHFMARDLETSMVDDSLVKVDRASMACSLEVRSPFLDHRVIEFAMRIPPRYKLDHGVHKLVLKQAFRDLLPPAIAQRAKQGFEVPFAQWFQKEPWRSLLIDMLAEDRLCKQGIFKHKEVINLRDQFLRDPEAQHTQLSAYQLRHRVWALLVFQMWHDQFMN